MKVLPPQVRLTAKPTFGFHFPNKKKAKSVSKPNKTVFFIPIKSFMAHNMYNNISSVVEFQRWWDLNE